MSFGRKLFPALLLLIFAFGFAAPSKADPPARIGRINYLSGSVSFERGDLDEWVPAAINYPMIAGDHLWADNNSRAELHVGSTAIRLAQETEFAFLNLDDQTVQIRLSEGSLIVRVRALEEDDLFEIDTPNAAVSLLRPGEYRIDVDLDGNTSVTAWSGEAEVTSAGSAFPVRSRESALIRGFDSPTYDLVSAPRPDDFDEWAISRDRREEQIVSVRYVSREMVGYEDLDQYGTWRVVPEYGNVWAPTSVPAGWAPYRNGHWVWIEPWGWTWVDDAPWGFAPFHYGRWAYANGYWYWVPGTVVARPVYAPALVAFVGGSQWSISLSFGSGGGVAWFPLGPREVYVPAYRVSETYVRNINVTHVNVTNINVTNINVTNVNYVNRTVPGGVTAVSQTVFTSARPVAAAAVVVPTRAVASATVVAMTAEVAPRRESLVVRSTATRQVAVAAPPARIQNRTVVVKTAPPPPPVPFVARERALAANPGRPLDEPTLTRVRQSTPTAQTTNQNVRPAVPVNAKEGTAPALRPAREGLPAPRPADVRGLTPERGKAAPGSERGTVAPGNAPPPRGQEKIRPSDSHTGTEAKPIDRQGPPHRQPAETERETPPRRPVKPEGEQVEPKPRPGSEEKLEHQPVQPRRGEAARPVERNQERVEPKPRPGSEEKQEHQPVKPRQGEAARPVERNQERAEPKPKGEKETEHQHKRVEPEEEPAPRHRPETKREKREESDQKNEEKSDHQDR